MPQLKDIESKVPKILIYSPAGTGKTALALSAGADTEILDMDDGVLTGQTLDDKWKEERLKVEVKQFLESDPLKAVAFKKFKNRMIKIAKECTEGKYPHKLLTVDSLTSFADGAVRYIMYNSSMLGQAPQIQHWGTAFIEIENILTLIRSLPIPVILLAHEQIKTIDKKDVTDLAVSGRNLPSKIRRFFDEVWWINVRNAAGGKVERKIQTKSTESIGCRSRWNMEDGINVNVGMRELLKRMDYTW